MQSKQRAPLKDQNNMLIEQYDEISIKENPKFEKLRKAPEEVLAKAIREMIRKDRGED